VLAEVTPMSTAAAVQLPAPERRAFSYARFSSTKQENGDSLRRQRELVDRYLAAPRSRMALLIKSTRPRSAF
jgi:hypothetical protein